MRRGLSGGSLPTSSPLTSSGSEKIEMRATEGSVLHRAASSLTPSGTTPISADFTSRYSSASRSNSGLGLSSIDRRSSERSSHAGTTPRNSSHHRPPTSTTSSSSSPLAGDDLVVSVGELTIERQQQLVDFIDRSVDDAYNLCHNLGRLQWQPSKNREGVSICRARAEEEVRLDAAVRGKCNIAATFDEVMDVLITETTDEFVDHESAVNPTEFLDGQVLYTLVPRTESDRFVCVKWHAVKSLAPSVAKHRDYIYIEVVDQFKNREGKQVGYRLCKSVELDELAGFDTSSLFVRGKTLTLQTFSVVAQGSVELYTMMINDLGERLPSWLVHKIVDTAALRSACIRDYINQKRMDLLVLARPKEMVPLSKRVCCVVCTKSFSLVRKKYNCVACGDVICNQCSVHQFVAPQGLSETVGKRKARICVKCSSTAKTRELPRRGTSTRHLSDVENRGSFASTGSNRSFIRSASHGESAESGEDVSQIHPSSAAPRSTKTPIPHMFQFRPTNDQRSSGRSTAPSTSPDDAAHDDDDDEEDDDEEHHLDFDNLLDESALVGAASSTTAGVTANGTEKPINEFDLGIGKYRKSYAQDLEDEELTDAEDDEDGFTMSGHSSDALSATSSPELSAPPVVHLEIEELEIEELNPHNGTPSELRASIASDSETITIVKPVVIKNMRKRSSPGGRRKSVDREAAPTTPPPLSTSRAVNEPVPHSSPLRSTVLVSSTPTTVVDEQDAPPQGSESIQLAELQVHLDRMTMISQSLRNLHAGTTSSSSMAADANAPPSAAVSTVMADITLRTQTEATLAADLVATVLDTSTVSSSMINDGKETEASVSNHETRGSHSHRHFADQHLTREDGSFSDYLSDSKFMEIEDCVDGLTSGWKAVHSKTTGKVYYYHEAHGTTSWTLPAPETHVKSAGYMVL